MSKCLYFSLAPRYFHGKPPLSSAPRPTSLRYLLDASSKRHPRLPLASQYFLLRTDTSASAWTVARTLYISYTSPALPPWEFPLTGSRPISYPRSVVYPPPLMQPAGALDGSLSFASRRRRDPLCMYAGIRSSRAAFSFPLESSRDTLPPPLLRRESPSRAL